MAKSAVSPPLGSAWPATSADALVVATNINDVPASSGYGEHPQEEWVAEVGAAGLAALDRAEGGADL